MVYNLILTGFAIAVSLCIIVYFASLPPHLKRWPHGKQSQMPPGPRGVPFFGSLLEWNRVRPDGSTMIPWLVDQSRYGEMTTLHMGQKTWVLLNTSRVVNEIFVKRTALTTDRPYMPVAGGLVSRDYRGFLSTTAKWREGRHLMHSVMMGAGSKDHEFLTERESAWMLQHCLERPRKWHAHNYRYCIGIMYEVVTGRTLKATDKALEDLQNTTSTFISSINTSPVDFFPILGRVPQILQIWRHRWQTIGDRHYELITQWWQEMISHRKPASEPSFVDTVLTEFKGREDKGMYLALSLITAGGDNPRMTMNASFMSCLASPQSVLAARKELESVCGAHGERLPQLADLPNCPFTCAMVKEVLRWRPTVPLSPQRVLTADLDFEGYHFPRGTEFVVNSIPVCYTGYEKPHEFRPERWLEVDQDGGRSGVAQDLWTFAFSGGRRMCVGYKLAQKELFVAMSRLIYCFEISPAGEFDDRKLNPFSLEEPFPVDLKVRSAAHEALIRASASSY